MISPAPTWPRIPPLTVRSLPSYARQTGLACSACHYQFLTLTPFGRKFKLNGYTLTNLATLDEKDSTNGGRLSLSPVLAALGHGDGRRRPTPGRPAGHPERRRRAAAGAERLPRGAHQLEGGNVLAVHLRRARTARSGSTTWTSGTPTRSVDRQQRADLRGDTQQQPLGPGSLEHDAGVGVPFIGSEAAPGGAAGTLIDEGLAQNVLGLGGYAMVANHVYGEVSVYRSALQGSAAPTSETGAIHGVAPYWRLALQKEWEHRYLMIGTFGLHAACSPTC